MKHCRIAGLVVAVALAVAGGARGEPGTTPFGMNKPLFVERGAFNAELAAHDAELGAKVVRMDLNWAIAEPLAKGHHDWSLFDEAVTNAQAHGFEILALVQRVPNWAKGLPPPDTRANPWTWEWGNPGPPDDPQDFQDFFRAAMIRYRPGGTLAQLRGWGERHGIRLWEIWNEPDFPEFWDQRSGWNPLRLTDPHDIEKYVPLLRAAYECKMALDPTATIAHAGTYASTVRRLYLFGAKPWFDVVNFHFYPGPFGADNVKGYAGVLGAIRSIRRTMSIFGDAGKPVWCTETGVMENDGDPDPDTGGARGQALYLPRTFGLQLAAGVSRIFYFCDVDAQEDLELQYGLSTTWRGHPIPATNKLGYDTYREMASILAGADPASATVIRNGADPRTGFVFQIRFAGERAAPVFAVWWDFWKDREEVRSRTVSLEVALPVWEVSSAVPSSPGSNRFDRRVVRAREGRITFEVGRDPLWVRPWKP